LTRVERDDTPLFTSENELRVVGVPHSRSLVLLLSLCAAGQAQTTGHERTSNLPRSFHDDALNITYFYPAHFEPVTDQPGVSSDLGTDKCARTTLIADSAIPAGPSSFVLSRIDPACPELLRKATALGPFTRVQLLRQLKQFGEARVSHEPTRYLIDSRPAAITLGSVFIPSADRHAGKTIYAAKACALSDIPIGGRKKSAPTDSLQRVLCFDFSTENRDLISLMFAFIIQFDNDPPAPLFPGSVQPSYWATGGRKPN
jgi:hypothetical protein